MKKLLIFLSVIFLTSCTNKTFQEQIAQTNYFYPVRTLCDELKNNIIDIDYDELNGSKFAITKSGEIYKIGDSCEKVTLKDLKFKKIHSKGFFTGVNSNVVIFMDTNDYCHLYSSYRWVRDSECTNIDFVDIYTPVGIKEIGRLGIKDKRLVVRNNYKDKIILTDIFSDNEKIEIIYNNGIIKTNKKYYLYGITNYDKCKEKTNTCEFGLIDLKVLNKNIDKISIFNGNYLVDNENTLYTFKPGNYYNQIK